jgi:hypothetical protein
LKSLKEENTQKPQHRWEDNIKINFKEAGLEVVKQIHLAEDMV